MTKNKGLEDGTCSRIGVPFIIVRHSGEHALPSPILFLLLTEASLGGVADVEWVVSVIEHKKKLYKC